MNQYKIEAGTAQHIGSRPQQNDRAALFTGARAPGCVLAVLADGLGNSSAPEQVLLTAKQLFDGFSPGENPSVERLADMLREIVHECHMIIKMNAMRAKGVQTCTFAALILTPQGQAVWGHVGESRVYHFFKKECVGRTNDSTFVTHLTEHDKLPLEAAKAHRQSKVLMNVLGSEYREPFVTIGSKVELAGGDRFMLCSDGLWSYFTDAELTAVTYKNTPREAAELLITKVGERAQGRGDNCTMAIIKLVAPPKEAPSYTVQKLRRAV
ncbi:MAG: serine/threonine-protein phosphatase [Pseudomonadota bacterium]